MMNSGFGSIYQLNAFYAQQKKCAVLELSHLTLLTIIVRILLLGLLGIVSVSSLLILK